MGQISLPRLEKINTTMHWESGTLYDKQAWAAPKLSLVNKLIIRHFFLKSFVVKKAYWNKRSYKNFLTVFKCCKSYRITNIFNKVLQKNSKRKKLISHYIYHSNNKYVAISLFVKIWYKQAPLLIL